MSKGWTDTYNAIDFNKVDDSEFALPETGFYAVDLEKCEPKKTQKNKPAIEVVLKITTAADGSAARRGKLFDTVVLTQEAAFRVKNLSSALHIDPPRSGTYDEVYNYCLSALSAARSGLFVRVDHKPDVKDPSTMRARVGRYYDADEVAAAMAKRESKTSAEAEGGSSRFSR